MRGLLVGLVLLFSPFAAVAQTPSPPASPPLTFAHHAVSTANAQAQAAFDDGLTLLYAFNPEEARQRFERASKLDPSLAMAQWGIALSWGVNINTDFDPADQHRGRQAIDAAQKLDKSATPVERALIEAAAKRYGFERKADADRSAHAYGDAMKAVAAAFPDDDEVQALAAEAAMDLRPWSYWSGDKPEPGTTEIVDRLNALLARSPQSIQANHLLIHILEASPHPDRALGAATRLAALHFEPAAEHLTHMPAHIFMQTGDYHAAADANARALDMFEAAWAGEHADGHDNYVGHDCRFALQAYMMSGEHANAVRTARRCGPSAPLMQASVAIRFRLWPEVAKAAGPLAIGLNDATTGKAAQAEKDARALEASGGNNAQLSAALIRARIAQLTGDREKEIAVLEHAVTLQDRQGYGEPPPYFFPIRESLGGAYFRAGRFAEAERVFRADLTRNPLNPRSLFGLSETLRLEGRLDQAEDARRQFVTAWRFADTTLDMKDL